MSAMAKPSQVGRIESQKILKTIVAAWEEFKADERHKLEASASSLSGC